MKSLVVDDSWITRKVMSKLLERFGIEALEADDGANALTILNDNPEIEIIFLDWNMPLMTGIEFLQRVKNDDRYKMLKVVMVTGNTEMSFVVSAIAEGVDEYIMLPIDKNILEEKLALLGVFPLASK